MHRINFFVQRNRWPRIFVVAILVSLNLRSIQAQDFIAPQRESATCRFCSRASAQIEPKAGRWKTWVINSGSQFRLPTPPDGLSQDVEIKNLITRANRRDPAALNAISFWDAGPPGYRWNEIAANILVKNNITGPRSARILALLNVAIY